MSSALRRRRGQQDDHQEEEGDKSHDTREPPKGGDDDGEGKKKPQQKQQQKQRRRGEEGPSKQWGCMDSCCWAIGNLASAWLICLLVYHATPSTLIQPFTDKINEALGSPHAEPPGARLHREGLRAKHPVVFVPGIVTGGLELWEGKECATGLFRKRFWGGTFGEVYKRPFCWMEHIMLDNETGLDPPGIRMRAVSGLVAADYFMPGYFVWAVIIEQLARLGYDEKTMHMASYDWRLAFQQTEERDSSLSRLKGTIELLVETNKEKVVVVPHSMGSLFFLFFLKWVEAPCPQGGGGGPDWVANHVAKILNIGAPFLGVPKAFTGLFSAEAKDIAVAREVVPAVMDSLQTLQYVMHVSRTWFATMSMLPKGGESVWGDLDWSPEQGFDCSANKSASAEGKPGAAENKTLMAHYGRLVSFGANAAMLRADKLPKPPAYGDLQDGERAEDPARARNISCGDVWTEYHEMTWKTAQDVAKGGVYTAGEGPNGAISLLRRVAPRMMEKGDQFWSYGVADDLDDPKYKEPKYWTNPLELRLPNAPDMEVHCLYGVGLLTERSYVYRLAPHNDTCLIPFRIDASVDKNPVKGEDAGCLKSGTYFVDGDETVPALSAGLACASLWRGKTRFNPAGARTYVREYNHAPPASLLEARGTGSGSHVDIMGNMALVEDILRVATGASGADLGGDRIFSKLRQWVQRMKLKL